MTRPQQYKPQIFLSISLRAIFSAMALMLAPSLVADEPVKVVIWAEGNMAYATVDSERQDPFDISTFIENQQPYKHTCLKATNLTIEDSFPLAVEIHGSAEADILVYKGSRSAVIQGGEGADKITGGTGNDTIYGEAGEDVIEGGEGDDTIYGGDDKDTISGGLGDDTIDAGKGNDSVKGGRGNDRICGGEDADELWGDEGADLILGAEGSDTLHGGSGSDTLIAESIEKWEEHNAVSAQAVAVPKFSFTQGDAYKQARTDSGDANPATSDRLFGGDDADVLVGGAGNDFLSGESGADFLFGAQGNDELYGGAFVDRLWGGSGDDKIFGGSESDEIVGGIGNDLICAGDSHEDKDDTNHWIVADDWGNDGDPGTGDGNDRLFALGKGKVWIWAGNGQNTIVTGEGDSEVRSGSAMDDVRDEGGRNRFFLGDGNNVVALTGADDLLVCRDGNDTVSKKTGGKATLVLGVGANVAELGTDMVALDGDVLVLAGVTTRTNHNEDYSTWDLEEGKGKDKQQIKLYAAVGKTAVIATGDGDDEIAIQGSHAIVFAHDGRDVISTGEGNDGIVAGAGDDTVNVGEGDDVVIGGDGEDTLEGGQGNDFICGDELPLTIAGSEVAASTTRFTWFDKDFLEPNQRVFPSLPVRFLALVEDREYFTDPLKCVPICLAQGSYAGNATGGKDKIDGGDGNDWLLGGNGPDAIHGGPGTDYIDGGAGQDVLFGDTLQRDVGADDVVLGGDNDDAIYGGGGLDQVYGGDGNDVLFGDSIESPTETAERNIDLEFGKAVTLPRVKVSQRLWGEAGEDTLHAWAADDTEQSVWGDELYGGAGADYLYGNLGKDLLIGGDLATISGDAPDYLHGDYHNGSSYGRSASDPSKGSEDILFGDLGSDQLYGGGGVDFLFGGEDNDWLEGMDGNDSLYGGSGPDLLVMDVDHRYKTSKNDHFDGHGSNRPGDAKKDDAVDILVVMGDRNNYTNQGDQDNKADWITIKPAATSPCGLEVFYSTSSNPTEPTFTVTWMHKENQRSVPLVEQFQIQGLSGDDTITVDLPDEIISQLSASSGAFRAADGSIRFDTLSMARPWLTTITGGSGNDVINGTNGRDYVDGGDGCDTIYGRGGDDRLRGGAGNDKDFDRLYAGPGNDDLFGGSGQNLLSAWPDFPLLNDVQGPCVPGQLEKDKFLNGQKTIDTGVNRMLGNSKTDWLFGGTGIDLLYGNGGSDKLYGKDGTEFQDKEGDSKQAEQWIAYARSTNRCWYVGGSDGVDNIDVNYVTNPRNALFGRHIASMKARGNFEPLISGVDGLLAYALDGTPVHDGSSFVYQAANIASESSQDGRAQMKMALYTKLQDTPLQDIQRDKESGVPLDDVLAMIIDAGGGDDVIQIGETVQDSVWIAAGAGNDTVVIEPQRAFLPDRTDHINAITGSVKMRNRNDDWKSSQTEVRDWAGLRVFDNKPFPLHSLLGSKPIASSCVIGNLTIDSARSQSPDYDWYEINLDWNKVGSGDYLTIMADPEAPISFEAYYNQNPNPAPNAANPSMVFDGGEFKASPPASAKRYVSQPLGIDLHDSESSRLPLSMLKASFTDSNQDKRFLLKVFQAQGIPTTYQIEIRLASTPDSTEKVPDKPTDLGMLSGTTTLTGLTLHNDTDTDRFTFKVANGVGKPVIEIVTDNENSSRKPSIKSTDDGFVVERNPVEPFEPCHYSVSIRFNSAVDGCLDLDGNTTIPIDVADDLRSASLVIEAVNPSVDATAGGEYFLKIAGQPQEYPLLLPRTEIPLLSSGLAKRHEIHAPRPPSKSQEVLYGKKLEIGWGEKSSATIVLADEVRPKFDDHSTKNIDHFSQSDSGRMLDELVDWLNKSIPSQDPPSSHNLKFAAEGGRLVVSANQEFHLKKSDLADLLGLDTSADKLVSQPAYQPLKNLELSFYSKAKTGETSAPTLPPLTWRLVTDRSQSTRIDYGFPDPSSETQLEAGSSVTYGQTVDARDYALFRLAERRDVIFGGDGNDRLLGGSGEDWIFGGEGNDVLSGGMDLQASDVVFGGAGDDFFQIQTDRWPILPSTRREGDPAAADEFDGGEGYDRILYLGGDQVPRQADLPRHYIRDFVMIGYDRFLARYRFATVPWEIPHDGTGKSTPRFIRRNDAVPMVFYAYFQAKSIEGTLVDTRGGEDIIHADSGFYFPPSGQSWGVAPGDVQAGAQAYERMEFRGGDGADLIYGSSGSDVIYGEDDADIVIGGQGDDRILGGQDGDYLYGRVLDTAAKNNKLYEEIILDSPESCQSPPSDAYVDLRYLFPTRLDHAWPSDSQIDSIICPDLKELATRTGSIDENVKDHYLWDHAFEIELPVGETVEGLLPAKLSDRSGFVVTTTNKQEDGRNESKKRFLQGPVTRYQLFRLQASDEFDENSPGADLKVSGLGWSYIMSAQTSLESAKIRADHQLPKLALEVTNNPSLTEGTSEPASILGFDGKIRKGWDRVEPILSDSTGTGESNTSKVSIKNAEGTELFTFEIQDHVIDEYFLLGDVDKDGFSDVALKVTPKGSAGRWAEFVVIMGRKNDNSKWTIPITTGASRPVRCFQFCRPENFYREKMPGISDLRAGDFDGNGIMDLLFVQESDSDPETHEFFIGYDFGAIVGTTIKTRIGETTTGMSTTLLSRDEAVEISPIESKLFYLRNKPDCIARQKKVISRLLHRKEPKKTSAGEAEVPHQVPFPLDFDGDGFEDIAIATKGGLAEVAEPRSQEKISIIFGAQSTSTDVVPQLLTNLEIPGAASALVENATGEEFVLSGNLPFVQRFENKEHVVGDDSNFGGPARMVKLNYRPFSLGKSSVGGKTKADLSLPPRNGILYFRHNNNNGAMIRLTFEIAGLKRERKVGPWALEEYRLHLLNGEFMFYVRDMQKDSPWELWTAKESNETLRQENRTFSIEVPDGTGTPQIFSHFWAGDNENWYKMRFVGDGQVGDYLALAVTEDSQGSDGAVSRISDKLHEFKPEFSGEKVASSIDGVFDLAKLRELRPDIIDSAKLIITFDNAAEQNLNYSLVDVWLVGETEDEAYVKFKEALALEGRSEGARSTLNLGSDCPELTKKLNELFYDRGFNRIRLIVKPSVKKVGTQRPYCWTSADQPSLTIKTKPSSGVVADLYTADGRFVRGGRQVLDLRHVKAGEYLLRVSDPLSDFDHPLFSSGFVREEPISYRIEIEAPKLGDFHPISDNDEIFGENGDDVVVGNHGFDRLLGGYGLDKIIGEADEVKDAGSYFSSRDEQPSGEPEGEKLADTSSELMSNTSLADRDPIIQDTEKKIEDPHLLKAIAKELGLYVGDESSGGLQLSRPIRSSDMAEIVHLRIEGGTDGKVTSLAGLEHALNLRSLDLTDHEVTNLEKLGPKSEGIFVYGARKLRSLRLDGNSGVSDLAPLAQMSDLRDLSLDGTKVSNLNPLSGLSRLTRLSIHGPDPSVQPATPGVSPTLITDLVPLKALKSLRTLNLANQGISDIHPLESLVNLAHLNLRNNKINEIESLADLRIADDDPPGFKPANHYSEYREFNPEDQSDFTSANSPWQSNLYPVTGKIGNDYRYVGPGSTGAAAEWTFKYLPEGTYEVWASWTPNKNRAMNVPYTITPSAGCPIMKDQRLEPEKLGFGGAYWQKIHTVAADGELKVQVSNTGVNGIVEADSIQLVRVGKLSLDPPPGQFHDSLLDDLRVVDLRGNPLNWHAIMPTGLLDVIGERVKVLELVSDDMAGRKPPELPLIPPQSLIPQSLVPNSTLSLDLSVPQDGTLQSDFGVAEDAWGIATQSDGKFVVVGCAKASPGDSNQLIIARYLPNGMLDLSFGKNGTVVIPGPETDLKVNGAFVISHSDNSIVVGTRTFLVRLHRDGSIDESFGKNGIYEPEDMLMGDVAIQKLDGNEYYIAAGNVKDSNVVKVVRLPLSGKSDGGDRSWGIAKNFHSKDMATVHDIAVHTDGSIVLVGHVQNTGDGKDRLMLLVKLDGKTGELDESFSVGDSNARGYYTGNSGLNAALGVALTGDGDIWVTGEVRDSDKILTYFGKAGEHYDKEVPAIRGTEFAGRKVAITKEDDVFVFGSCKKNSSPGFALLKFKKKGELDTSFGSNGVVWTGFGGLNVDAWGGALLGGNQIATVGWVYSNEPKDRDFLIAMHNSQGMPITTNLEFSVETDSPAEIKAGIKNSKLTLESLPNFDGMAKVKLIAKDTSPGNEGLQSEVVFDVTAMPSTQDVLGESLTSGRMFSDVAVLPEGKYVVAWSAPNNGNAIIKAQIFDKSGKALREAFDVASGQGNSQVVNVASNEPGQFVIQWECPGPSGFVRALRYGSEFSPIDQEAQEFTNSASIAGDSSVVMLPNGDVLAAWESGNRTKIELRMLQSSDSKMGEKVQVAEGNSVLGPQFACNNDSNCSVLWQSRNSGSKVFARRFENASGALSEQFELSTEDRLVGPPKAFAMTTDSGLVVPTFDAGLTAVFLQNFDKDFKERRPKIQVETEGVVSNPTITLLAGGGYVLGWHRVADVNDHKKVTDFVARRYAADGQPLTPVVNLSGTFERLEGYSRLIADDDSIVATWTTYNESPSRDKPIQAFVKRIQYNIGGVIHGSAYVDENKNGFKDDDEEGIEGWKVFLDSNADNVCNAGERTTITDSNGDYCFTGLQFSDHHVVVDTNVPWKPVIAFQEVKLSHQSPIGKASFPSERVIEIHGPVSVMEGAESTFDAIVKDPNPADSYPIKLWWSFADLDQIVSDKPNCNYVFPDNGLQRVTLRAVHGAELYADVLTVMVTNEPPTAKAKPSGDYSVTVGAPLELDGSGSSDPAGTADPLQYSWDINGDGTFDDAVRERPSLTWEQLQKLGFGGEATEYEVRVRVDDGDGGVTISDPVKLMISRP